jgi:hypothetical protein
LQQALAGEPLQRDRFTDAAAAALGQQVGGDPKQP